MKRLRHAGWRTGVLFASCGRMIAVVGFAIACVLTSRADAPKEFAELQTKSATYRNVRVISQNPSSITVRHSGGIAQIPFTELSPELQEAFGYVPAEREAFEAQLRQQAKEVAAREAQEQTHRAVTKIVQDAADRMDTIVHSFGTLPGLKGVDMRPRLRELELYVKDQGRSPSCAVYAVVSALELQAYEINGHPEKYSEPYLIWATIQVVGERAPVDLDSEGAGTGAGSSPASRFFR